MTGRVWSAMIVASAGFGTGYVATRSALTAGVEPLTLVALRFTAAAFILVIYLGFSSGIPRDPRAWTHGILLGLLYMATPTIWFTVALQHVSAGFGALLIATIPLATAVWAHLLLPDEPLGRVKAIGLALALFGMAVMVLSGESGILGTGDPVLGAGLILIGVAAASLGYVYTRRLLAGIKLTDLAVPQFASAAAVAVAAAGVAEGLPDRGDLSGAVFQIGYLAVASTVVPFVILLWLIKTAGATRASLLEYLVPVVGVVVGWAILNERVTAPILLGGLLILTGVWVTESPVGRQRSRA